VPVGQETANRLVAALKPKIEALKVGPATDAASEMGPLITREAQQRVLGYIETGLAQGAELAVDGRSFSLQGYENGFFVGPTLFDHVTPEMDIYREEIFGPVLSVVRATTYEEALSLPMKHMYGNGVAIFTRDGDAARDFASRINIGMVGINVPVPVPLAYHSFGGWKASSFGDLNQHGTDSMKFWTRTKTVTARWPSGIKQGAEFQMPTYGVAEETRASNA
jgi:malonate-semialdehyde dehydrogenase (acetylating)/methylmalonate-semialdehyde dehydrogenase